MLLYQILTLKLKQTGFSWNKILLTFAIPFVNSLAGNKFSTNQVEVWFMFAFNSIVTLALAI